MSQSEESFDISEMDEDLLQSLIEKDTNNDGQYKL